MVLRRLWPVLLVGVAVLAAFPAMAAPTEPGPAPTPTVDRLAAPPTVTNPTQADLGAQLFWLHCQPCHGDQAQGLTDDWRAQYPPEDQNCWTAGCHGDRPYQGGFTLPHSVPALIGPNTLSHFGTAADLYAFMSHAMPFQAPGSLKPEEYWAITAFLLRGHGLGVNELPLTDSTAAQHIPLGAPGTATLAPAATGGQAGPPTLVLAGVIGMIIVGAAGWTAWRAWRRDRQHG
jgi:mono/diheme cytochrome c family protein